MVTLALPAGADSRRAGDRLSELGFLLSYESGYLLERRWIQVCLMGSAEREGLESLLRTLPRVVSPQPT